MPFIPGIFVKKTLRVKENVDIWRATIPFLGFSLKKNIRV